MNPASASIRWGILGAARIARRRLIPAIQRSAGGAVVAIGSRDRARAASTAQAHDIPEAFGSYQAVVEHADVDALYIPLPNHLHVAWAIRALEAGKHVLVEKPVGRDAVEARALADAADRVPHLVAMEAFMYRFHPRWRTVQALVSAGDLGALRAVDVHFSYRNVDPGNVRNRPELGGGALLDIGCYGVSVARWLFGREPGHVSSTLDVDPALGIDRRVQGALDFGEGTATFTVATQEAPSQWVRISGDAATIDLPTPFNPPDGEPTELRLSRDGVVSTVPFPPADHYREMVEEFQAAIRRGGPAPVPLADAVANMRVLDRLRTPIG